MQDTMSKLTRGPSGKDVCAFSGWIVVELGEIGGISGRLRAKLIGESANKVEGAAFVARPVAVVLAACGRKVGFKALTSAQTVVATG